MCYDKDSVCTQKSHRILQSIHGPDSWVHYIKIPEYIISQSKVLFFLGFKAALFPAFCGAVTSVQNRIGAGAGW